MPIVSDADGKLVGNLSISDIRALANRSKEGIEDALAKPVEDFVSPGGERRPVISVSSKDSLLGVIELMCTSRVHRVYITQADAVVGLISITDVLKV